MAGERQDSDQRADTVAIAGSETNQSEAKNVSASSTLQVSLLLHPTKKKKM
jgi:hypothetical protein